MSEVAKKQGGRHAGLDILRILSMVMVVVLHYLNENLGGVLGVATGSIYYLAWVVESLCYCAVNIFVLISGYFLCNRETTNTRKVVGLLAQVLFYSVGLYILGCILGVTNFRFATLVTRYLFPTTTGLSWFVTDYVLLYLLAPYINRSLNTLTQKQHRNLAILLIVLFSVIPTAFFFQIDVMGLAGGYSLIWFMVLYVIAAYIRKYGINANKWCFLGGYVTFSAATALCKFAQKAIVGTEYFNLYKYTSVTVLGAAICLFCFFKDVQIKRYGINKVARTIASLSFAIFLIHTHSVWVDWLWQECIRATAYLDSPLTMMGHMLVSAAGIFAVCCVVDFLRKICAAPLAKWFFNRKFWDK